MDEIRKDYSEIKRPLKYNHPQNNRLITYLRMMWNILTAQIREETYDSLISRRLLPVEKKECRKLTRGTGELLYIDKQILKYSKAKRKILSMEWIDNKRNIVWSRNAR